MWAFGVVLFEMLTGTFLFGREDVTDTLAAVLTYEPDVSKLPAATPAPIRRLIERCLVKDKKLRLDSMIAARIELDDAISGRTTAVVPSPQPAARGLTPAVAAAAALAAAVAGVLAASFYYSRAAAPASAAPRLVAQIAAPREAISAFHDGFAISSDAHSVEDLAYPRYAVGIARRGGIRRGEVLNTLPVDDFVAAVRPMERP